MENQKVVIVGASHGGHESAIEILDKYEHVDVLWNAIIPRR